MSLSDNYEPLREIGDGVTVEFSDNWDMISADYADVFLEDATTGVLTPVDQGGAADEYQITLSGSGFIVTFNTAPTSANYVVIGRNVTIDQTTPYTTSTGFRGNVIEGSLDKITAIAQDIQDETTRALKFQVGSGLVGSLPTPTDDLPVGWDGIDGTLKNNTKTFTQINNAVDAVDALVAGSGVKVSANDTTTGFLNGKLVAGDVISFTENNDGGAETLTLSVANGDVTNAKLADVATSTIKGRTTAGTGAPEDLTPAQARTVLDVYSQTEVDNIVDGIVSSPSDTSVTGTTQDFAVSSGAKIIKVPFAALSTNGTSVPIIQIGDSGGIETTGYLGASGGNGSGAAANFTTGAALTPAVAAASVMHGFVEIIHMGGTKYSINVFTAFSNSGAVSQGSYTKSLTGELTTVRFTTVNGTDEYDAGTAAALVIA